MISIIALLLGIINLILLFLLFKKQKNYISKNDNTFIDKNDLKLFRTEINNSIKWLSHYKEQIDKKVTYLKSIINYAKKSPK